MTGLDQLQYLSWLLYLFVFVAVLVRTIRRPTPAHVDMTLFFGAIAILIILSTATAKLHIAPSPWIGAITGAAALSDAAVVVSLLQRDQVRIMGPEDVGELEELFGVPSQAGELGEDQAADAA